MKKIDLHIYDDGSSESIFYEDDGLTYKYQSGDSLSRKISIVSSPANLTILIAHESGKYLSTIEEWEIILHTTHNYKSILVNNQKINAYENLKNTYTFNVKEEKSILINIT